MLLVKGVLRALAQTLLFGALLLWPAGTWDWPRATQFLVVFAIVQSVMGVLLAIYAPESLEARLPGSSKEKQPIGDRLATLMLSITLLAWFLLIPLDVFRWHLLPKLPAWASLLGLLLLVGGYAVMVGSLVQNAFAIPVVKEQEDRGQFVVDTGLYGLVRHPMYLGLLLFLAGLALWLESTAALVLVPLGFCSYPVSDRGRREDAPPVVGWLHRLHRASARKADSRALVATLLLVAFLFAASDLECQRFELRRPESPGSRPATDRPRPSEPDRASRSVAARRSEHLQSHDRAGLSGAARSPIG